MRNAPRRVSPDAVSQLKAEAYQAGEDLPDEISLSRHSKEAAPLGERSYRPTVLRPWPIHTDFRPYETPPQERGRWD